MPEISPSPGSLARRSPDRGRPEVRVFVDQADERRHAVILLAVALLLGGVLGLLGFLLGRRSVPLQVAASPVGPEATKSPSGGAPIEKDATPPERESNRADAPPTSPGDPLAFEDVQDACGDLASRRNYLCLLNREGELLARGSRLVVDEALAKFSISAMSNNGVSIGVEGKERYSLRFGPPKGKPLIPGFYGGALSSFSHAGPYPGLDVSTGSTCEVQDGRFLILDYTQTGDGRILRFVADFDSDCNGAIGRISIIRADRPVKPRPPLDPHPRELAGDSTR